LNAQRTVAVPLVYKLSHEHLPEVVIPSGARELANHAELIERFLAALRMTTLFCEMTFRKWLELALDPRNRFILQQMSFTYERLRRFRRNGGSSGSRAEDPGIASTLGSQWIDLAFCERDFSAASRVLAAAPANGIDTDGSQLPKPWFEGLIARGRGDESNAGKAFRVARVEVEKTVREQPEYAEALSLLGGSTPPSEIKKM
jgi:hypothetical protein